MKKQAEIYFERKGLRIAPSYNPAFVIWLKETVPPSRRVWTQESREWWIDGEFAERVLDQLGRFFTVFETDDRSFRDKENRWDHKRARAEFDRTQQAQKEAYEGMGGKGGQDRRNTNHSKYKSYHDPYSSREKSSSYSAPPPPPRDHGGSHRRSITYDTAWGILGVVRGSDAVTIKLAWRAKAVEHHPDRNGGTEEAQERMKEINAAYDLLKR